MTNPDDRTPSEPNVYWPPQPTGPLSAASYAAPTPVKPRNPRLTFWTSPAGILSILVIIGGLVLIIGRIGAHTTPTGDEVRSDAKRACQEQFIAERLKAPATAKYSGVTVSAPSTQSYGVEYTVTGSVDSENSFGALVRSSFTCVVHSSGNQWVLSSASVS